MSDRELSYDEAEAAGFDGTGRDLDPRFPYHLSDLDPATYCGCGHPPHPSGWVGVCDGEPCVCTTYQVED